MIVVGGVIGLGDYLEVGFIVFLFILVDWFEFRLSDKVIFFEFLCYIYLLVI